MFNIIQGKEFSNYETVGISLGISKNDNRENKKSRYFVFQIANSKNKMVGTRKEIFFEDKMANGLWDLLNTFSKDDPLHEGGKMVDLAAFKESEFFKQYEYIMSWPGGIVIPYPLKKGECYVNDVNRKRVTNKWDEPVTRRVINVFCQIDFAIPGENGQMDVHYFEGFGPEERGDEQESRFFREAVQPAAVAPSPAPEVRQPAAVAGAGAAPGAAAAPEISSF